MTDSLADENDQNVSEVSTGQKSEESSIVSDGFAVSVPSTFSQRPESEENSYHFEQQSILTELSDLDIVDDPNAIIREQALAIVEEHLFASDAFDDSIAEDECLIEDESPLSAADKYINNCRKYLLTPGDAIVRALRGKSKGYLNLSGYRQSPLNIYFLCQALVDTSAANITHLDLSYNLFEDEACITLSELMQQSFSLRHVDLSSCNIGPKGVEILADGIQLSQSILTLNLSKCDLRDSGGVVVATAVAENDFLKSLNISYNQLHVLTAEALQKMLWVNNCLENLNLKWNDFYPEKEASIKIMNGLRKNSSLKSIDLSWNGITGIGFARALARVMRTNEFIKKIYINNNFLTSREVKVICSGIRQSLKVRDLHVGGNVFTMEDYELFINVVELSPTVRNISFGRYTYLSEALYKHAIELNKVIQIKDPHNKGIIFKGQLLPNPPEPVDFRTIIIDRAKYLAMKPKKKKLRRDMGHFMLSLMHLPEDLMNENDFQDLLKKFKARLDPDLIKHFMEEFREKVKIGKKLRKRVAVKQMAEAYLKRHPTDPPLPPKPKKKRKKKRPAGKK